MVATIEQVQLHKLLTQLFLLSSLPTYIHTRFVVAAPFGRHLPKHYPGPKFNARISWCLFESPNLIWSWYCCWHCCDPDIFLLDSSEPLQKGSLMRSLISLENNRLQISTNAILLFLFTLHYANRAIIYPLRMSSNSQPVPLHVTLAACLVTFWNGYLQCFYLVQIEKLAPLSLSSPSLGDVQTWAGVCVFFAGMGVNVRSDNVLRNLRKHGPGGKSEHEQRRRRRATEPTYHIPRSPLFARVSCPNLAGELLEWFGFALASRFSFSSVAFFVYTASNLIPRAVAHHEWYLRKFDDYPVDRKWAVIPFVI